MDASIVVMVGARAGEEHALEQRNEFGAALLGLVPKMRMLALSLCRCADEADDLVQETLLKAWAARERFEPGSALRAWVFTILKNSFLSRRAKARPLREGLDLSFAEELSLPPDQEWRLYLKEMLSALESLKPLQREALILVVGAGLSYEEAAAIARCPANTMKSRVKRARTELARKIHFDGSLAA